MFAKLGGGGGVKVHCTALLLCKDNGDTLVSYAPADSATVLSVDRNMLRYTGQPVLLKKTHPFTREERRHLVKDFRDDAVRSLCIDACLHASPAAENPLPVYCIA